MFAFYCVFAISALIKLHQIHFDLLTWQLIANCVFTYKPIPPPHLSCLSKLNEPQSFSSVTIAKNCLDKSVQNSVIATISFFFSGINAPHSRLHNSCKWARRLSSLSELLVLDFYQRYLFFSRSRFLLIIDYSILIYFSCG